MGISKISILKNPGCKKCKHHILGGISLERTPSERYIHKCAVQANSIIICDWLNGPEILNGDCEKLNAQNDCEFFAAIKE